MKKYTLKITKDDDGRISIISENDGFNSFELFGFISWKSEDIRKQIEEGMKPDYIERNISDNE